VKKVEFLKKARRMLSELVGYAENRRVALGEWSACVLGGESPFPPAEGWEPVELPHDRAGNPAAIWFRTRFSLPEGEAPTGVPGMEWELELHPGGESLVLVDGVPVGEWNVYHRRLPLDAPEVVEGSHELCVQVVARGLFGTPDPDPFFRQPFLVQVDVQLRRALELFSLAIDLVENTADDDLARTVQPWIIQALDSIRIPRDYASYAAMQAHDDLMLPEVTKVWDALVFEKPVQRLPLSGEDRGTFLQAARALSGKLSGLKPLYTLPARMVLTGHAHIDYAWLWPVDETLRKMRRTFSNALSMARRFPSFLFAQSSAAMYQDVKEIDPPLFARIVQAEKKGCWELLGGMWVESDCSVPSAESLVRQFLYGQRFFQENFGKKASVCWLPDVFGFSWILPQIIRGAGMDAFFTTKLTWNDTTTFPYDHCHWRGLDGSSVLYHSMHNPHNGYNSVVGPRDVLHTYERSVQRSAESDTPRFFTSSFPFGYGDGGGGPTDEMMRAVELLEDFPGLPALRTGKVEEVFRQMQVHAAELPVWEDELYLERHRGTLTSQARLKREFKQLEELLFEVEWLCRLAYNDASYPAKELEQCWKTHAIHAFHDILPGSSIHEVYDDGLRALDDVRQRCETLRAKALSVLTLQQETGILVLNVSDVPQPLSLCTSKPLRLVDQEGHELLVQPLEPDAQSGKRPYLLEGEKSIPAGGYARLQVMGEVAVNADIPRAPEPEKDRLMENEWLRVGVHDDGTLHIFSHVAGRNVFSRPGNRLVLSKDVPGYWDAWDVDDPELAPGNAWKAHSIQVVEDGPIRKVLLLEYREGPSTLQQRLILHRNLPRLDIHHRCDWRHRRTLLRAFFPLDVFSRTARFDLSAGFIERSTLRNTLQQRARFEVAGHRWVDMSEPTFGVSILNDGKYGFCIRDQQVGVSLLRSPVFPDYQADLGAHEWTLSIFPHAGQQLDDTLQQATLLNRGLQLVEGVVPSDRLPERAITLQGLPLGVMAFKRGEDGGTVLRLVERNGRRGKARVNIGIPFQKAFVTNLLEQQPRVLSVRDGSVELDVRPFQILTLLFS